MATYDAFNQFVTLLVEHVANAVPNLEFIDEDPAWDMMGTFEPEAAAGRKDDRSTGFEASWRVKKMSGGRVGGGTRHGCTPESGRASAFRMNGR